MTFSTPQLDESIRTPPAVPSRIYRTDSRMLAHDAFRAELEREVLRHKRYLSCLGLIRIGPAEGTLGSLALGEALETETRATDSVCALDDGTYVVLVLEAEEPELLATARRLDAVAEEIGREAGCAVPAHAGLVTSGRRRVSSDELWRASVRAFETARSEGLKVVCSRE